MTVGVGLGPLAVGEGSGAPAMLPGQNGGRLAGGIEPRPLHGVRLQAMTNTRLGLRRRKDPGRQEHKESPGEVGLRSSR